MLRHRPLILRPLSPKRYVPPPSCTKLLPNVRLFTQNTQLLLISPPSPRPQLPFLHPPSATQAQHQLFRFLSTETKLYLKNEMRKTVKYVSYGLSFYVLFLILVCGVEIELYGRKFPTPPEWGIITRVHFLTVRVLEDPVEVKNGLVDWAYAGNQYRIMLARLENPAKEGPGVQPISGDDEEMLIEGVNTNGVDISSKSEAWRTGYYEILMGLGRAAENLDGWVRDTSRQVAFPAEVIIGPSNPKPKPVPFGAMSPPFEENCVEAFEKPDIYYTKALKTRGFSTRQRLDAALAYGKWLDFKGLSSSAEEAYDWALDIATGALPVGVNNVVDIRTGVINDTAEYISSNVLLATTRLAIHHASNNNLATALPIFLSILRARRKLPPPTKPAPTPPPPSGLLSVIKSIIMVPEFQLPSHTGDEPQTRTPTVICEEAAIMAHIGEILFASSKPTTTPPTQKNPSHQNQSAQTRQSGLSWTRDAVNFAEAALLNTPPDDSEARQTCADCLEAGMDNWSKMVAKMLEQEEEEAAAAAAKTAELAFKTTEDPNRAKNVASSSWGFFWRKAPDIDTIRTDQQGVDGRWKLEAEAVAERMKGIRRTMREEGVAPEEGERNGGLYGMFFG